MTDSCMLGWVEEYVAFRRGLGFDLKSPAWYLRSFARYAKQLGHRGPVTRDLATRWALASRSGDPAQAARRLGIIRSFAQHRALIDPATEIPPLGLLGRVPRRKQPHIYSEDEIRALLRQASQLLPRGGLSPRTYVAFLSLLFSTGLRLSEGCSLTCKDVDLGRGLLTIRGTKFRKSRWVPLHPSTTQSLKRYARDRDAVARVDAAVLRQDPACVRRKIQAGIDAEVYRNSTGVSGLGKFAGKDFHERSAVHFVFRVHERA